MVYLRREDTARFTEPPPGVLGFCIGTTDPRPDGEPWPVVYDDEPGAA